MLSNDGKPTPGGRCTAPPRTLLPIVSSSRTRAAALVQVSLAILLGLPALAAQTAPAPIQPIAALLEAARAAVLEALPAGQIHVDVGPLDTRLRLAACGTPLQARAGAVGAGRATVRVDCGGPVRWSVFVPARIESQVDILRLQRALARGERVAERDVLVQTLRVPGAATDYVTQPSQIADHHARRALEAGTVLRHADFAPDPVIRRGERVTLVARLAGLEVRSDGIALQDAQAGSRVQVRTASAQRVVEGRAEAQGREVRVLP